MAGFPSLEIGRRAIVAQRYGLDVTSNNIANINTPGYTRQTAVLTPTAPLERSAGLFGTGVFVSRVDNFRLDFFDKEIRNSISRKANFEAQAQTNTRVEAIMGESSDYSLDGVIQEFFNAWSEVALRPESVDRRRLLLDSAETLASNFRGLGANFNELRADVGNRIELTVNEMNALLKQVGELNSRIQNGAGGSASTSFNDQRALAMEKLAQYAGVTASIDKNGLMNVSIAGNSVVTGAQSATLRADENIDSVTGERTKSISVVNANNQVVATLAPATGELASLLDDYNVLLDEADSSGGFSVFTDLNQIANEIATRVNTLTNGGYGIGDNTAPPPGRNFFEPPAGGGPFTIKNIAVSSDVKGNPEAIPVSEVAGEPGNNGIARRVAGILTEQNVVGAATLNEFYNSIVSKVGSRGYDAEFGIKTASLLLTQLENQRDTVNGVSLDEEAVNLIQFQKAFEASARVVNTANELLGVIVNLGR